MRIVDMAPMVVADEECVTGLAMHGFISMIDSSESDRSETLKHSCLYG
jgi:hypothetical protein